MYQLRKTTLRIGFHKPLTLCCLQGSKSQRCKLYRKCQVFHPAELCCGRTEFAPFSSSLFHFFASFVPLVSCPETLHSSPVHKVQLQEVAESTSFAIWTARLVPSSNKNQNHHNNNNRTKLPRFNTQLKPEGTKILALPSSPGQQQGPLMALHSHLQLLLCILNNLTRHCHLWKYLNSRFKLYFLICK